MSSDLLPLVAAALNDRVAAETHEELTQLKRELKIARAVEILHGAPLGNGSSDDVVVYASAQFEQGCYGANPNLWTVPLENKVACRLADLRSCRICVGGGITLESLDDQLENRIEFDGYLDPDDDGDTDNSKYVSFCFPPNTLWLGVVVQGWPRREWEAVVQADDLANEDMVDFLVNTVAEQHPEAVVEFISLAFTVNSVPGAIKRLLPPTRREEVEADRLQRTTPENRAYSDLVYFVSSTMRNLGNQSGSALFIPQVDQIMEMLSDLNIHEQNDENQANIVAIVTAFEQSGPDAAAQLIAQMQALLSEENPEYREEAAEMETEE